MACGVLWLAILAIPQRASATSLIGTTVDSVYYYPDSLTPYAEATFVPFSFVIGPGQETDGNIEGVTHVLVDFDATSLLVTFETILVSPTWDDSLFNGVIFTTAVPHGLLTATVDGSTTMGGFDNSRVSLTIDQILLNWSDLDYVNGTTVKINFTPEPASALLIASSALLVALSRRRRA